MSSSSSAAARPPTMIAINYISDDLVAEAKAWALELGQLTNSLTKGEGNTAGYIGERLVANYLGAEFVQRGPQMYDYDLMLKSMKIEVKTKRVNTPPRPDYQCSISEFSLHQQPDIYVFVRILNNLSKAWILGWIPRERFMRIATKHKKGEACGPKFQFSCDTYNVDITDIHDMSSLLEIARIKTSSR